VTEDTDDILRDIRRWVKIIGIQEAKSVMNEALSAEDSQAQEELRIIYHLSDGEHSTRDIAEHVSVGRQAVSNRQSSWSKMSLLEKEHSRAPYEHVISLEEAGLEVPEIPDPEEESDEAAESHGSAEGDTEEEVEEDLVDEPELTDYE
jgi:DNA-binding MarR family transcriptional regulator